MAEAFALENGLAAGSAGTNPAKKLNPTVVQGMRRKGSTYPPQLLSY